MRNIKKIMLSSLLIVVLPSMGAPQDNSGTGVGVQAHSNEVVEGSGDAMSTPSQASLLSPGYILQGIQNAYLPLSLRMTSVVQAFTEPKPSSSDFWDMAKKSEKILQDYVPRLLEAAATYFKSSKFTEITSSMKNIVGTTAAFRNNITSSLDAHHITFDTLIEELEGIFMKIVHDLQKIPSPDKAPGHAERTDLVNNILDDTAQALTKLLTRYGVEEEVVTKYMLALRPHVLALLVAIGDINEQHPQLLPVVAFSVASLLIPESWILRPFLSVFGFGPAGPVKGSAAAWIQRRFWGAAVKSGSWFSWLQAAGMGVIPKWAGFVAKTPLLVGGLLAMLLPCLHRG